MKKNNKLWIVTELFWPDQTSTAYILHEISVFLSETREVEVICGPINFQQKNDTEYIKNETKVNISRVSCPNFNKNNLFFRTIKFILISILLSIKYLAKSNKKDIALIVTNPAPLLLLFALIAKFLNRKIYLLIHDVFPENTIPAKIFTSNKSILYKFLKFIFDHAYSQFDTLVVLGRDMKLITTNKVIYRNKSLPKLIIIENWADTDEVFPIHRSNLPLLNWVTPNKFIFLFAGNMGRIQAIDELMLIIQNVSNSFVHFVFLGEGASKEKLKYFQKKNKLNNVTICGSFPRSKQCEILNSCHVGLVSQTIGMLGLGVPSKSYNILASGKPILYFGDEKSEISLIIKENNLGWSFNSSQLLLNFFNQIDENYFEEAEIFGRRSRDFVENNYTKKMILKKFEDLLC